MAGTPQGNAIAYQALKAPEPLKVGDIYSNMIDGLIKRNDAQKAAQMKALQDQQKEVGEWYKTVKIDPFATTAGLTDASGKLFKNTADFVSDQYMKAQQDPKNRYAYMQRANNAMNDYKTIASALGSQDFIKKADEKQKAIATGEYYLDSDDEDQYKMLLGTMFETGRDPETGMLTWNVPQNLNAKQGDPAAKLSTGQIISRYTDLPQKNYLPSFEQDLQKNAKDFADSYSNNTDGNRTKEWKGYAKERGDQWFNSTFGSFNAQQIDPRLQQWSKSKLGKEIQTSDDYEAVKQSITDNLSSYVPTDNTIDTKYTKEDLDNKKANTAYTRARTAETYHDMANDDNAINITPTIGATTIQIKDKKGNVVALTENDIKSIVLPKKKGMPEIQNTFGVTKVRDANGNIQRRYLIGSPDPNGEQVYTTVSSADLIKSFNKAGYGISDIQTMLNDSDIPINPYKKKWLKADLSSKSKTPKAKVRIAFKTNYQKEQADSQNYSNDDID